MANLSFERVPGRIWQKTVRLPLSRIKTGYRKYGSDFVKKAASATEEENRDGKEHERGRNEGKENDKNDVGTRAGGVKQPRVC